MKKGFYFTMDALLATILLVTGLLLITHFFVQESQTEQIGMISRDVLVTLNEITLNRINDPFIDEEIRNGNITNLNATALYKIAEYWSENKTEKAKMLAHLLIGNSLPQSYGINISMGSDVIYNQNVKLEVRDLVASRRMISGIAKGRAQKGSSSAAYLKRIRDKRTATYIYFGGYEGQGNITKYSEELPSDVRPQDITEIMLELDVPTDFTLFINDKECGVFNPVRGVMQADSFNATHCKNDTITGSNKFRFEFEKNINVSYIAGGYIRLRYKTDEFQRNTTHGLFRHHFPGVEGLINIYSSFYVPGIINSYKANITFYNNYSTFMTVGNETIFNVSGSNTTQNIYRARSDLDWVTSTIPLRLGIANVNFFQNGTSGEPADILLVSDVSGSMDWCGQYTEPLYQCRYLRWVGFSGWQWMQCQVNNINQCNWGSCPCGGFLCIQNHLLCRTRLDILKQAANSSVEMFLNSTGTRLGLVSFSGSTQSTLALTNDAGTLHSEINSYSASGGTCICCGIQSARAMYPKLNGEYMIVIGDGDATVHCGSGNANQDAIAQGQAACAEGIDVYTIGFGDDITAEGTETLRQIACDASKYYDAGDVLELEAILANITEEILLVSNYTSQTIEIQGNVTMTNLSHESYLEINYTPYEQNLRPNEITIAFQSERFNNCTPQVFIPEGLRLIDAKLTSYSGPYWTDEVHVNSHEAFNLSKFSANYYTVGDPFVVQVPTNLLNTGEINYFNIRTGDEKGNYTNCSHDNSLIYLGSINSSTTRTDVVDEAEGCKWLIEFEDGTFINSSIPPSYLGFKNCSYTNASISYDHTDAYDISVYNILRELDFDKDGRVFVNLHAEDLEVVVTLVSQVPYMWGPSFLEVKVWR